MLGCELWTENFDALLALVKEYIINLLEARNECVLCGDECESVVQIDYVLLH